MNEFDIINIIKNKIGNRYIGDDCAYLKDFGMVVTQDSFVENIHFKRDWYTPFQLGYKSVIVNISDIIASGAIPKYITIALSLPANINENFISEFYDGAKSALHGAEIIGGDITGSKNDIIVSITAIGDARERNISSRSNAKPGHVIVTGGLHGSSALGLLELMKNGRRNDLIMYHIEPHLNYNFANSISKQIKEPYAMMDTSDGLADALFKIAQRSCVKIIVDYNKIPHINEVSKEQVLFGGEDYQLVASIPKMYLSYIDNAYEIGYVDEYNGIFLDISGEKFSNYSDLKVYNHFE